MARDEDGREARGGPRPEGDERPRRAGVRFAPVGRADRTRGRDAARDGGEAVGPDARRPTVPRPDRAQGAGRGDRAGNRGDERGSARPPGAGDERPRRAPRASAGEREPRDARPARGPAPRTGAGSSGAQGARSARGGAGERARPTPTRPVATGPMRLQRALARAGIASRRHAESLIAEGRVAVNGRPAQIGQTVDPGRDAITVDGRPIGAPVAAQWLVLHKPAGVLTTRSDPEGRRTVFDIVAPLPGLTYVGRLDYMTEGVLLLTTDGDAAHRLTHPSREVERTYVAIVRGPAPAAVRAIRQGLELEDGPVRALGADARPLGNRRWELELTITEGRTREVRRICETLDLEVERLVRVSFGPVRLGTLPSGATRPLTVAEQRTIDAVVRMEVAPRREREAAEAYDDEY